jgi:hypothetical protein
VIGVGLLPVPSLRLDASPEAVAVEVVVTVSTKLFHSPQFGQRPVHFGCSAPHCWQTNMVRVLDFGGIFTLAF